MMKKLYFTQVELSEIIDEETHTIRYWESIFPILRPKTIKNGRRVYNDKNIDFFRFVKKLIRNDKLSNSGVKEHIESLLSKDKLNFKREPTVANNTVESNTVKNIDKNDMDSQTNSLITFTREEFAELLQIIQMMILLIKSK